MLVARVVDHEIHDVLESAVVQAFDQVVVVGHCAVRPVDVSVVGDVVAHVDLWRGEDWREPYDVHAEGFDVVELGDDAAYVAVVGSRCGAFE